MAISFLMTFLPLILLSGIHHTSGLLKLTGPKRSLYVKRLSSVTTGCDLYVSFFDRGLDTLKVGGTLCFICADRWLQNKYGTLLRSRMGHGLRSRVSRTHARR